MILGYTQITDDVGDIKRQNDMIMSYAAGHNISLQTVYSLPSTEKLKKEILKKGDTLIISNIARLGNSMFKIRDCLTYFMENGISLISVKEAYIFTPDEAGQRMLDGINLALDIRKHLLSNTTTKSLARKKADGVKLGRAKNTSMKKLLDGKEREIKKMLARGMTKDAIAKRLNVSRVTLYNFLNKKLKYQQERLHNA